MRRRSGALGVRFQKRRSSAALQNASEKEKARSLARARFGKVGLVAGEISATRVGPGFVERTLAKDRHRRIVASARLAAAIFAGKP